MKPPPSPSLPAPKSVPFTNRALQVFSFMVFLTSLLVNIRSGGPSSLQHVVDTLWEPSAPSSARRLPRQLSPYQLEAPRGPGKPSFATAFELVSSRYGAEEVLRSLRDGTASTTKAPGLHFSSATSPTSSYKKGSVKDQLSEIFSHTSTVSRLMSMHMISSALLLQHLLGPQFPLKGFGVRSAVFGAFGIPVLEFYKQKLWSVLERRFSESKTATLRDSSENLAFALVLLSHAKWFCFGVSLIIISRSYQLYLIPFPSSWRGMPFFLGSKDLIIPTLYGAAGALAFLATTLENFSFFLGLTVEMYRLGCLFAAGHAAWHVLPEATKEHLRTLTAANINTEGKKREAVTGGNRKVD